jgi:hypothetical protein
MRPRRESNSGDGPASARHAVSTLSCLGGAGQFGLAAARMPADRHDVARLVIAGRSFERCAAATARLGAKAEPRALDVDDAHALQEAMLGVEAVVTTLPCGPGRQERVIRAAVAAGVHVFDLNGERPSPEVDSAARRAGVRVVTHVGSNPGVLDLAVRRAREALDHTVGVTTVVQAPQLLDAWDDLFERYVPLPDGGGRARARRTPGCDRRRRSRGERRVRTRSTPRLAPGPAPGRHRSTRRTQPPAAAHGLRHGARTGVRRGDSRGGRRRRSGNGSDRGVRGRGGAEGIRTPDLLNAIQTRSQLRHSPRSAASRGKGYSTDAAQSMSRKRDADAPDALPPARVSVDRRPSHWLRGGTAAAPSQRCRPGVRSRASRRPSATSRLRRRWVRARSSPWSSRSPGRAAW